MAPIIRPVLRDGIKNIILERVLKGEYKPGERIVETQLARELGTSQGPVREVLRELEALGFVESEPYRGVRVKKITQEEILEIYPVRAALEELAAREAAVNLSGDVLELRKEYQAMLEAAVQGDTHDSIKHSVNFHRLIVMASGNKLLFKIWSSLGIEERTLITQVTTQVDLLENAKIHEPILEAIANQDAEMAGRLMREHIESYAKLPHLACC
jgi:DNA-binding GntR family transcriptional regulator